MPSSPKHARGECVSDSWGYISTAALRDAGLAKKLFGGRADNVLAELFFGGIVSTLHQTPYVTIGLDVSDRQVRLSASAPYDRGWAGESRILLRSARKRCCAAAVVGKRHGFFPKYLSRHFSDVAKSWRLAQRTSERRAGKSRRWPDNSVWRQGFWRGHTGALGPEIQFVVTRQEFAAGQSAPAIKLPAFGLVTDLKDPAKMQPELRRTFQNLIGFLNVVGAMNGQPQFDLDMEKTETSQFVTASYLPDPNAKDQVSSKINYNFSPSIAFTGSRFVVASTKAMVHTLATANSPNQPPDVAAPVVNTDAVLHFSCAA